MRDGFLIALGLCYAAMIVLAGWLFITVLADLSKTQEKRTRK